MLAACCLCLCNNLHHEPSLILALTSLIPTIKDPPAIPRFILIPSSPASAQPVTTGMPAWAMQPINFITSLLGLTQGNTTSDDSLGTANASQRSASCSGWSKPDPLVRLRLSGNNTVRIFGFPQQDLPDALEIPLENFGTSGYTPLLYLRADVPAHISYIMGSDWRDNLRDDHQTDSRRMWHDGEVILRPGASLPRKTRNMELAPNEELASEEQAHCVRMLRCGAKAILSEVDSDVSERTICGLPDFPEQIFGWPSTGGVWILRKLSPDNPMPLVEYGEFRRSLSEYTDMDALCRALQDAGGEYYEAIEDCPEAVQLGLDKI